VVHARTPVSKQRVHLIKSFVFLSTGVKFSSIDWLVLIDNRWTRINGLRDTKIDRLLSGHFVATEFLPIIQAVNTASDELSPETFYHQGLEVLHSVVLYWTACTVLYSTMRIMFQWFPGLHFGGSFNVQPARTDSQKYALYIMRSVKYFLQPEAGLHGAQNISFPLGVALNYLAAANETPTEE